jgi:peptidoglycan/LPS O-acetylase OafA/YrhL
MPEPVQKKEKVFFPNLDGLRFLSFFSVFVFHVYTTLFFKYHPSTDSVRITRFLFQNGEIGVNFFFVLSGFLITYLLLEEKRFTGHIHVGKFYLRRILRIWPLFYLCLAFGFLIYPQIQRLTGGDLFPVAHPWTYFVFLNNFDFLYYGAPAALIVLWSVAIEEQFYILWPLILVSTPRRWYKWIFFLIIGGTLLFRFLNYQDERVLQYHSLAVTGDMALGGLLAYYSIFSEAFKRWVTLLPASAIAAIHLSALAVYFFRKNLFTGYLLPLERLVIGALFGLIILEQNYSKNSLFKMSRLRLISQLGIYTYGLYCLHMICLKLSDEGARVLGLDIHRVSSCVLVAIFAFFVAIAAALLSYTYFERRFLNLKNKFAFIIK